MKRATSLITITFLTVFMILYMEEYTQRTCVGTRQCTLVPPLQARTNSSSDYDKDSNETEPIPGEKHLLFIEPRCAVNASNNYNQLGIMLTKRQTCSIESAARTNSEHNVYLLYTCPMNGGIEHSEDYVKSLFTYSNLKIWRLNVSTHFADTPLENWDFETAIRNSKWPEEHSSDVLRLTALWKYGGTYLDLNVLLLKPLSELETDYVVMESYERLRNSVLSFEHSDLGHEVANMCLLELLNGFRGDVRGYNGPDLITRVFLNTCHKLKVTDLTTDRCMGFRVLSKEEFFPLANSEWRLYFNEYYSKETMERVKDSYAVHLWSSLRRVFPGSNQPYNLLASSSCPKVYSHVGKYF